MLLLFIEQLHDHLPEVVKHGTRQQGNVMLDKFNPAVATVNQWEALTF